MRARWGRGVAGLVAVVLVATGCTRGDGGGGGGGGGGSQGKPLTIYSVTHGTPGDPFWAVYRKGLDDAAADYGVEVKDLAPEKFSVEELVNQMNSAVAADPDGIIATITDPKAVEAPLRKAIDQGIPVIAVNVADPRPESQRIPYLYYVGSNEELAGETIGERVLEDGTPKHAVCAIHEVGVLSLEQRCQGIQKVLEAKGATVDKLNIGQDPTQAAEVERGYLQENPDTDAIFTLGPLGSTPTLQVLEEEGLTGQVTHATFDLSNETLQAIQQGKILATVDQQQYLQGYLAVEGLAMYARDGFVIANDLLTGPAIVDKTNVKTVIQGTKEGIR